MGSVFGPIIFLLPVCRLCWFVCTLNIHFVYAHCRRIFSATVNGRNLTLSQASYKYAILWEAFLDPSDSYFLFADFVDFYTHWTYMLIFRRIFLSNYWWQKSDIWSQASYRYPISWVAFLDPSYSYFRLLTLLIFIHIEHICTFSSHFSQQLLMAEIWYLVTSFI